MTRRDRIAVLVEYLIDVREGLPDKEPIHADELIALMCQAWNSPAYQELERLLPLLRKHERRAYWHLCERYLRYGECRVAWCRRCGYHHASKAGQVHRHPPGRAVQLRPKVLRVVNHAVDDALVGVALNWLDAHWQGEAVIPKAVLAVESERRLRAA